MIKIIVVIVIGITLIVGSIIRMNKTNKRIKELEQRLTEYYKERENRLKSKGVIRRGPEWPE